MASDAILPGDPGYDAMRFCRALNIAALVLAIAVLAYPWPNPALIAVVALVPVLAVAGAFASGGEITLGAKAGTTDSRPTAVFALWLPALALALDAWWTPLNLLHPQHALWAGLIVGVFAMLFILLADPIVRYSVPRSVPLIVPVFLYGAGLAPFVDVLADRSAPLEVTSAQVLERHVGAIRGSTYYLGLAAWGEATVTKDTYDRAPEGTLVCIELHSGVFAMEWYHASTCT